MYVAGVDEVGRGALAGPLVAVAAMFRFWLDWQWEEMETAKSPILGVNDSKKLTPTRRRDVFHRILNSGRLVGFGLGEVSVMEINEHGVEWANRYAFARAVEDLPTKPTYLLIDGDNPLPNWDRGLQRNEPRADGRYWPVGAASIIAKVVRDDYMAELGRDHPEYGWERNSGYGSRYHQEAIQRVGPCQFHRTQFISKMRRP